VKRSPGGTGDISESSVVLLSCLIMHVWYCYRGCRAVCVVSCRFGIAAEHAAHAMFWINFPAVLGCIILVGGLAVTTRNCAASAALLYALLPAALRLCRKQVMLCRMPAVSVAVHGLCPAHLLICTIAGALLHVHAP
jgi:hypothetical protein